MTCGADGKDARGNDCSDKMDGDHDHMDHWKHCLETMSESECTKMKMNGEGMFAADSDYDTEWLDYIGDIISGSDSAISTSASAVVFAAVAISI